MKAGTILDGIRCLETLKAKCVIDRQSDCWLMRKADGSMAPPQHRVQFAVDRRSYLAARLAWQLAHPKYTLPKGHVVWRCCDSPACVNPDHLRGGPKLLWGQHVAARGIFKTPEKREAAIKASRGRCVLTPELRQWLLESSQSNTDAAHGLGIGHTRASQIRIAARRLTSTAPASVFDFARFALRAAA